MMKIRTLRASLLLTLSLMPVLLVLAGCDNPAEYKIPNTICGRNIDPSALKSLLPSGQEFKANQESIKDYKSECVISVDGTKVLRIDEHRDQNEFDITNIRMNNPVKSDVGEDTLTSDDWLISVNACPSEGNTTSWT
ncbi:hypothetical protein ACR6C2_25830 [Streptomyces sp. INA 01156]